SCFLYPAPTEIYTLSLHDALPILPALWKGAIPGSEKWFIVDMIPGAHPLDKLEAVLMRVAADQAKNLREQLQRDERGLLRVADIDRKSTRLNSSHVKISYAVFCLK